MSRTNCCDSRNHDSPDCVCDICLEKLNDNVVEVNCGNKHFYHKLCIEGFINAQMDRGITRITCPNCRTVITQYGCNGKIYDVQKYTDPYDIEENEDDELNDWQRRNLNMYNLSTGNRYLRGGKKYKKRSQKNKRKSRKYKTKSRRNRNKSRKYYKR